MKKILILHGPNLNLLGTREPLHYGTQTLEDINLQLIQYGKQLGYPILCYQSNAEDQLIDKIQEAPSMGIAYLIFNPAAYTHTSIALRDALLATGLSFIEVHLSNIYQRETYRHYSYFSDIAKGTLTGFGAQGYFMAIDAIHHHFSLTE
jgi:3-dehydroquinate dehydratase II